MAAKRKSKKNDALLTLDTEPASERRKLRIDGEDYEVRFMEELSFKDRLRFAREASKLATLGNLETEGYASLKDSKIDDMESALNKCVKSIVIAPKEVLDRLQPLQKMQIVQVFSETPEEPPGDSTKPTGESLPSSDSTEEAGRTG